MDTVKPPETKKYVLSEAQNVVHAVLQKVGRRCHWINDFCNAAIITAKNIKPCFDGDLFEIEFFLTQDYSKNSSVCFHNAIVNEANDQGFPIRRGGLDGSVRIIVPSDFYDIHKGDSETSTKDSTITAPAPELELSGASDKVSAILAA